MSGLLELVGKAKSHATSDTFAGHMQCAAVTKISLDSMGHRPQDAAPERLSS
jgi:hypothetical protein